MTRSGAVPQLNLVGSIWCVSVYRRAGRQSPRKDTERRTSGSTIWPGNAGRWQLVKWLLSQALVQRE
jgi:hypothetical protein